MATTNTVVEKIAAETGWKSSDVRNRARWLIRDGYIPKGKPGPNGGAQLTSEHLIFLLLSLACPDGKRSSNFVKQFAALKTEFKGRMWTLKEAMLDRLEAWRNDDRLIKQDVELERILLIFDEKWPTAEMQFRDRGTRDMPVHWLRFAKGKEGPDQGLAELKPAVVFNGGLIMLISDILDEVPDNA